MSSIIKETSNTISSLVDTFKNGKREQQKTKRASKKEKDVTMNNQSTLLNSGSASSFSERSVNSVSQRNKPKSAIIVNKSNTIRIIQPKEEEDVYFIIDELKEQQPVMVKLNAVDQEIRKNIMNYIKGACHSLNFKIEKTDDQEILVDPNYR